MHVRVVTVRTAGSVRRYAQLVQSYRRSDGMPTQRVLAHLGDPESIDVQNLRVALRASADHQRVTAVRPAASDRVALQPTANLRYLDVAVLLSLWRSWGLDALFGEIMPSRSEVPMGDVVAALAIQRCVDPGSKLYATEWVPRTALPLLLSLSAEQFNNTRVHRVLDELDRVTPRLMGSLVERYQTAEAPFATLFIDATDTWFVGEGPPLAARGKTKEGRLERKVGIVLLCDQRGYPLRWEVIGGRTSEVTAMSGMLNLVSKLSWSQGVPLVCDRAMGRTAQISALLSSGLTFVTALTQVEFDAYTARIPHAALARFEMSGAGAEDIAEAGRIIAAAGLERIDDRLFVLDLGVVERVGGGATAPPKALPRDATAKVMELARSIHESIAAGRYTSEASAARAAGISKQVAARYGILRRLPEAVQQQILAGEASGRSLEQLLRIARLADPDLQQAAFVELLASPPPRRASARPLLETRRSETTEPSPTPIRVRAILYFNPQLFVDERARAAEQLAAIQQFVTDLNGRLAAASRMNRDQIAAAIDRQLRKDDLLDAFTVLITEQTIAARKRFHVELQLNPSAWERRRRHDGFNIIVAHPSLARSAAELVALYRAKDAVEKDFRTIKSVVEIRPIRHRTDEKVRAHVTLCMLALLLERTLEQKLDGLHTAEAALELLATTHLNHYAGDNGAHLHVVTRTDDTQNKILRRLRLQHLADYQPTIEHTASP